MEDKKPLQTVWIMRLLVAICIVLAVVAGYYFTTYDQLKKSYTRLEVKYQKLME